MPQPTETTDTPMETLLAALVAQVEAENADLQDGPEPETVIPFPTVL